MKQLGTAATSTKIKIAKDFVSQNLGYTASFSITHEQEDVEIEKKRTAG